MFAKTIIGSDAFIEMPTSARLLYYDLGMRADDDGFINSPKSIMRMTGASDDDMKLLIAKKFIIPFESGVVVIKHWNINNYIQKDRYTETKYKEEKALLQLDENKAYKLPEQTEEIQCIQNVYKMDTQYADTQVRLGKVSIGKDSIDNICGVNPTDTPKKSSKFIPPTLEEVQAYCYERNNNVDAEKWFNFYQSKGWMVGKNKMKDWKAAVRTWERENKPKPTNGNISFMDLV